MSVFTLSALKVLTLELARLLHKSETEGLDANEVKTLDLLIKNQALLTVSSSTEKKRRTDLSEEDLLRLLGGQ